jgi:hypothetical protein
VRHRTVKDIEVMEWRATRQLVSKARNLRHVPCKSTLYLTIPSWEKFLEFPGRIGHQASIDGHTWAVAGALFSDEEINHTKSTVCVVSRTHFQNSCELCEVNLVEIFLLSSFRSQLMFQACLSYLYLSLSTALHLNFELCLEIN